MKAFPTLADNGHSDTQDGMDLRDYFAAKAMQALIHDASHSDGDWHLEANAAYKIADAMIKARKK